MGLPLIFPRNPLAYPGSRRPGFDPSHPAAPRLFSSPNILWGSAFVAGNQFQEYYNGSLGTISGSQPAYAIDGAIGPAGVFNNNANLTPSFTSTGSVNAVVAAI